MLKVMMFLGVTMLAGWTLAGNTFLQLSVTPDVSIFGRAERVEGLTLGLWSENPQSALALGVVNGSTGQSAGLSLALILNYADNYKGIEWAPINYVTGDMLGWQSGIVNYTGGTLQGLQSGTVNYAGRLTGLQLGVVNFAAAAQTGVQIGLVNLMPRNQWFSGLPNELAPGMVFINWRF